MRHSRARPVTLMVTAVIVAGLLAACGSSSSTSSTPSAAAGGSGSGATGAAGAPANRAKLEACLKQHGVTLPTRPAGSGRPGGGGSGAPPSGQPGSGPPSGSGSGNRRGFFGGGGGFRANPKLRAAFQACGGVRGGFGRRGGSALSHASIQKFVTCVRQHGYDLPQPNFSGKGAIFPAKIESNAKFQAASRACRSQLTPSGGPPNGGAPPSGA